MVELQPLQAAGDLIHDVPARQADRVRARSGAAAHLGGDDHVLASDLEIAQGLPEQRLGLALGIDVGRVDEIDAGVQRAGDQRRRALLIHSADGAPEAGAAAECHGSQADFRDELPGPAERSIAHEGASRERSWRADRRRAPN